MTVYYQALCEYWQSQDSTQTESYERLLDIYYYNQIYYWSKNESQDCRKMCYVTFVSVLPVLIEESRGPKHNWPILPKALHPSSFHCCQPQDPSHVFVLPSLLALCARLGARPLVFVCPRKLLERESYLSRGNKTRLRSLSFLSFTTPSLLFSSLGILGSSRFGWQLGCPAKWW